MHWPTRSEARGVFGLLSTTALVALLSLGLAERTRTSVAWWAVAWFALAVGIIGFLSTFVGPPLGTPRVPGWFAVWRRQRGYKVANEPTGEERWPQRLSLIRDANTALRVRCFVTSPRREQFERELETDNPELNFPGSFIPGTPVRPPRLPDGEYRIVWEVAEPSGKRRRMVRRRLKDTFVARGRPRWERVGSAQRMGEKNRPVLLTWDGGTPWGLRCVVRHIASGREYRLLPRKDVPVPNGVGVLFPDSFDAPTVPEPGEYEALWEEPSKSGYFGEETEIPYNPIVVYPFVVYPEPKGTS
jgi:hypothetical protein